VTECAASLGLLGTPKIKFLNKRQKDARHGVPVEQNAAGEENDDQSSSDTGSEDDIDKGHDSGEEGRGESNVRIATICFFNVAVSPTLNTQKAQVRTKYDRMFSRKNQNILSSHYTKLVDHENPSDVDGREEPEEDDNDFFALKRVNHDLPSTSDLSVDSHLSK